jgi:hypothetical protein
VLTWLLLYDGVVEEAPLGTQSGDHELSPLEPARADFGGHRVTPATVCGVAGSEKSPQFGDSCIAGRDGVGQSSGAVSSCKDPGRASTADQERKWLAEDFRKLLATVKMKRGGASTDGEIDSDPDVESDNCTGKGEKCRKADKGGIKVPSAGKRGSQGGLSCATVAAPDKNREQDISCRTKENVLGEGAVSIDDGEQPSCQLMGPPELRRNRPRAPLPLHHRGMQDISRDSDAQVGLPYRDAEEDSWGGLWRQPFPKRRRRWEGSALSQASPLSGAGSRSAVRRVTSGFPRPPAS